MTSATNGWIRTLHCAELAVDTVKKGEGVAPGDLVYVRYWRRRWIGRVVPLATSGHRGLPAVSERVRAYLVNEGYDGFGETRDGGFNVVGANGFAKP